MNIKIRSKAMRLLLTCVCCIFAWCLPAAGQSTYYWDLNGAASGCGVTLDGTWNTTSTNWSTSSAGTAATAAWVNNATTPNIAYFAAAGLATANSYTVTLGSGINASAVKFYNSSGLAGSVNTVTLAGSSTLTLGGTTPYISIDPALSTVVISAPIAGSAGLAVSDATTATDIGTLVLSGNNTYTGITLLRGSTLQISSDANLGAVPGVASAGRIDFNLGALSTTASFTLNANRGIALPYSGGANNVITTAAGTTLTYNGIVAGAGGFNKQGAGTLVLGGTNTNVVGTSITSGTLSINGDRALGAVPASYDLANISYKGSYNVPTTLAITSSFTLATNRGIALSGQGNNCILDLGGNTLTYGGIIYGSSGYYLTVTGNGTLALSGANSGGVFMSNGTLRLDSGTTLATGGLNLGATAAVALNFTGGLTLGSLGGSGTLNLGSRALTVSGADAGGFSGALTAASLTKSGAGSLSLSGTNNIAGAITVSGGLLDLAGTNTITGPITVNGGTLTGDNFGSVSQISVTGGGFSSAAGAGLTLTLGAGTTTITNQANYGIAGSGSVLSSNATLGGTNTYTGTTSVVNGSLTIDFDARLGAVPGSATAGKLVIGTSSSTNISNPTLVTTSSFTLNANRGISIGSSYGSYFSPAAGTTLTYGGVTAGTGRLIKSGTGTLVLSGTNTHTGGVTVSAGVLSINNVSTLGPIPATVTANFLTLDGGTLATTAFVGLGGNRGITINSTRPSTIDTAAGTTLQLNGIVTGSGNFTLSKKGAGTVDFLGTWAGSSSTSTVLVDEGLFKVGPAAFFPSATIAAGATLDISGGNVTASGIGGAGTIQLGASTLTLTPTVYNATPFTGTIVGTGGVAFGPGSYSPFPATLVNTYTGPTTFNSGAVQNMASDANLGAVPASPTVGKLVLAGGTLNATTSFAINSNRGITLTGSSSGLSANTGVVLSYVGIIAGTGDLTKAGLGSLVISGVNTYSGATTLTGGILTIAADQALGAVPASATAASLSFNDGSLLATSSFTLAANRGITVPSTTRLSTLNTPSGVTIDYAGIITYGGTSGVLGKTGDGTLRLGGSVAAGGGSFNLSGGAIQVLAPNALNAFLTMSLGTNLALGSNATVTGLNGSGAVNLNSYTLSTGAADSGSYYTGVISGSGGLNKTGASSSLILTGTNTFTGPTNIAAGTLTITSDRALGAPPATPTSAQLVLGDSTYFGNLDGGDVTLDANRSVSLNAATSAGYVFMVAAANTTLTINGVISGQGILVPYGSGVLRLGNSNTWTGSTLISSGACVEFIDRSSFGTGGCACSGGTLRWATGSTYDVTPLLTGTANATLSANGGTHTLAGRSGANIGTINFSGPGNFVLGSGFRSNNNPTLSGGVNVTFSYPQYSYVTLDNGTLTWSDTGWLTRVFIGAGGGTLDTGSFDTAISGSGYAYLNSGANASTTITKRGSGNLTLYGYWSSASLVPYAPTIHVAEGSYTDAGTSASKWEGNYQLDAGTVLNIARINDTTPLYPTLGGRISGSGTINKSQASTLTLSNLGATAAQFNILGGTVIANGPFDAAVTLSAGTTLQANSSLTLRGLSGSGTVNLAANQVLVIAGPIDLSSITLNRGEGSSVILGTGGSYPTDLALTNPASSFGANNTDDITLPYIVSGSGFVSKQGSGNITLSGANTYTGDTLITGGTITFSSLANLGSGNISITGGGGLRWASGNSNDPSFRFSAATAAGGARFDTSDNTVTLGSLALPSDPGRSLVKAGSGTLILPQTQLYTGSTTVEAGTLQLGNGGTSGGIAGPVSLGSGATLALDRTSDFTLTGVIGGTGSLHQMGSNTVSFPSPVALSSLRIDSGALAFNGGLSLSSALEVDGGSLAISASVLAVTNFSGSGGFLALSGQTFTVAQTSDTSVATMISGSSNLVIVGSGTLALTHANTYTGGTTHSSGTLAVGDNAALGTGTLTLGGGAISAYGGAQTIANATLMNADSLITGNLALTFAGPFTLGRTRDLTVNATVPVTISGVIGESGSVRTLNKYGSGELVISGANTYTGSTTIAEGTIRLANTSGSAFGSGAVTIASGATLAGNGSFSGSLQNNGTFSPGNSPGLVSIGGSFVTSPTGTLLMQIAGSGRGTGYDAVNVGGTFTFGGTLNVASLNDAAITPGSVYHFFSATNYSGAFSSINLPSIAGIVWDTSSLGVNGSASANAISKTIPSVTTWPTASAITHGQSLSASAISGGSASVAGSFTYDDPATTPSIGIYAAAVTFTPSDAANYSSVAGSINVVVIPATHTPTQNGLWNDPATWGGTVPAPGDNAVIPAGVAVTLDGPIPPLGNLTIAGTLNLGSNTIQVSGDFIINGTFNPGTGTVELTGGADQILAATGSGALTFYNLTENKTATTATVTSASHLTVSHTLTLTKGKLISASFYQDIFIGTDGTLELTNDITISGNLTNNGTLNTAGHGITFDGGVEQYLTLPFFTTFDNLTVTAGTTLIETDTSDNASVMGTLVNHGVIRKTQLVDVTGEYFFGLAGLQRIGDAWDWLSIDVTGLTGGDPLTAIQVDCIYSNHPSAPGTSTTGIYWTITPVGSDFAASVILPHNNLDNPQVCRYRNAAWDWDRSGFDNQTVTRPDVTAFGDFAVFNNPQLPTTTTTLTSSVNPSTYGASFTFTATVSPSAASGTVTFKDGAATLGTGTLSGGTATFATSDLAVGNHTLTAEFAGDPSYAASTSSELSQSVNKATPTVNTWPIASAITYGQSLANSTLSGGSASVAGTFAWTTSSSTPTAGAASQGVTFTPADVDNYATVAGSVNVVVIAAAPPELLAGSIVNNLDGPGKVLTFTGTPDAVYQAEASSDLQVWTPLGSFTAGTDGHLVITDTAATTLSRFYRFNINQGTEK